MSLRVNMSPAASQYEPGPSKTLIELSLVRRDQIQLVKDIKVYLFRCVIQLKPLTLK